MLYEMTTGRRAFTGPDTMAILTSLAIDEPDPPHVVNPACPPALSQLTMELLAKVPDRRPASADVVARRLGQLELPTVEVLSQTMVTPANDPWSQIENDDETIPVASPATPQAASRRGRKLSLIAVGVAILVVGVLALFGSTIVRVVNDEG